MAMRAISMTSSIAETNLHDAVPRSDDDRSVARMDAAKRLLLAGTSQLEVTAKLGFAHPALFCARFRQLEGIALGRWRMKTPAVAGD